MVLYLHGAKMCNIGVTGHRKLNHPIYLIKKTFLNELQKIPDIKAIICGMAVGWDQLVAETCLEVELPFIAAVPFKGQEVKWPIYAQKKYFNLLEKAAEVHYVSDPGYAAWKMHKRNEWIVNNSTCLISYFDGLFVDGSGTAACTLYAQKRQKPILNVYAQISV
jgi:uncharacterized phage-like protein YoqJ